MNTIHDGCRLCGERRELKDGVCAECAGDLRAALHLARHDPFEDEHKLYTREQFVEVACGELRAWLEASANVIHKEPRNWRDWFGDFFRYMSF